jgi:hypothetical protein
MEHSFNFCKLRRRLKFAILTNQPVDIYHQNHFSIAAWITAMVLLVARPEKARTLPDAIV